MANKLIFVYGTLRKGGSNNYLLSSSIFIGKAKSRQKYALYVDGIPYVIKEEQVSNIIGEVYKVNKKTLERIDQLEGYPCWYNREKIPVILDNGEEILAWIYFNPRKTGKCILTGDYLNRD